MEEEPGKFFGYEVRQCVGLKDGRELARGQVRLEHKEACFRSCIILHVIDLEG
jgi:hypothetical protein